MDGLVSHIFVTKVSKLETCTRKPYTVLTFMLHVFKPLRRRATLQRGTGGRLPGGDHSRGRVPSSGGAGLRLCQVPRLPAGRLA